MPDLEPITREETLLDGGDLTPITRKEMFIKRIYDKNQSVPEPITREEYFLAKAGEGSGGDVTIEQLNVTENGTYSESGKAYSPVVVNVPTPPIPENAYLLNNLSGLPADIASFNDGTDLPMAALKVSVTPYQDLHGYDAPWAGGSGKNILPTGTDTTKGYITTSYLKTDGTTGTSTNYYVSEYFEITASETYSFCMYPSAGGVGMCFYDSNKEYISGAEISNGIVTVQAPSNAVYCRASGQTSTSSYKTLVCKGSTKPASWTPYSNICTISGWTEANVTKSGKNLFNLINGTYTPTNRTITINNQTIHYVNNGAVGLNYILRGSLNAWKIPKLSAGKTYSFKYTENGNIGFTNVQLEIIHDDGTTTTIDSGSSATLSKDGEVSDLKCDFISTTPNTEADITLQLEVGQATAYEPYNGQTYTIDLDGTRYGGVVDATNGTMDDTLDHIASYNGEALPSTWISDRDVYAEGTTPTIGAEVVYTRATPITVQLAPTPVKSLVGTNNIFADCGDIIELEYFSKEV